MFEDVDERLVVYVDGEVSAFYMVSEVFDGSVDGQELPVVDSIPAFSVVKFTREERHGLPGFLFHVLLWNPAKEPPQLPSGFRPGEFLHCIHLFE